MKKEECKSFGYYFLNKRLHPPIPKDYRVSIILLIINKNRGEDENKFLIVQQANKMWGLPKEGIKSDIIVEDLYTTISRNLENELGFKGIKVVETKPLFKQVSLFFDFARQDYDFERSSEEEKKGRPTKGKTYLLAMMEYRGPDVIPLAPNPETIDFKWVTEEGGQKYFESDADLVKKGKIKSLKSQQFSNYLFHKAVKISKSFTDVLNQAFDQENKLF